MIDFKEIQKYLPQRFPMIMVDRVLGYEKGKSLTAVKNVTANEIFFLGHFPGFAIMPGALILEGFGQSASILYQLTLGLLDQDEIPLYGSVNAKFFKTVIPGDQLIYEIETIKITSYAGLFKAVGRVNMDVVARAELGLGKRRNREPDESTLTGEPQHALSLA
ncbi:MAG TPA: 3-hydroxyacyl-ACP dehydratase FabZ [Blastocatellia bacterium]|nr:3-hydroxyacyl-ACP dehydratase FabZ [Blastocatellia bacterium]